MSPRCTWSPVGNIFFFIFTTLLCAGPAQNPPLKLVNHGFRLQGILWITLLNFGTLTIWSYIFPKDSIYKHFQRKQKLTWLLGRWKNREHFSIFDSSQIHCEFRLDQFGAKCCHSSKITRQITLWYDQTESVTLLSFVFIT